MLVTRGGSLKVDRKEFIWMVETELGGLGAYVLVCPIVEDLRQTVYVCTVLVDILLTSESILIVARCLANCVMDDVANLAKRPPIK